MNSILFFVHTPFQLFVAQHIVVQEKISDAILLLGTVGRRKEFYEAYGLMKNSALWSKTYELNDLAEWAHLSRKRVIMDVFKTLRYKKYIDSVLVDNDVDNIFLGDINNISCKFTAFVYARVGIKISFYEEGVSHYYFSKCKDDSPMLNFILSKLTNWCFYYPIWHFSFGEYMYNKKDLFFDKLPIFRRYSIIDKYKERYDVILNLQNNVESKLLNDFISDDIKCFDNQNRRILLMSQPIWEEGGSIDVVLDVIAEFLNSLYKGDALIVKFHPREDRKERKKMLDLFRDKGIQYKILSEHLCLPVELYLQHLELDEIVMFISSTYLYAEMLCPSVVVKMLLNQYIMKCAQKGYDTSRLCALIKDLRV